jgi:hypothetical protein
MIGLKDLGLGNSLSLSRNTFQLDSIKECDWILL